MHGAAQHLDHRVVPTGFGQVELGLAMKAVCSSPTQRQIRARLGEQLHDLEVGVRSGSGLGVLPVRHLVWAP